MNFKFTYYWLLLLIPLIFISWFFISKKENKPIRYLAYFGPKRALKVNDTTYHFIPPFEFTDQYNEKVNETTVKGKIYVTEYFFTTCRSICPIMNDNLDKVYALFKNDPDFMILSHTVDPETDSVPVLREYAAKHGVMDKRWLFVTGEKPKLYDIARKGYLLNAEEGNGGGEDFIHTQNFALVDKDRHIRGFYDGTDSADVSRMIMEIKILQQEYAYKAFILSFLIGVVCVNSQTVSHVYKIDGLLKRISHPDTTYVVNFWATWCKPCIQELPAFDSLTASVKHTSIKVLLVSLDFSEERDKKVNPFLNKNNVQCECVLLDEVNGNDFINQISQQWSGAIPATLVKHGNKKEFLERKLSLKQLEDEILKMDGRILINRD